jgi:hypothetical protein
MYAVEVVQTRLQFPLIVGTLAIVTHASDYPGVIQLKDAEALAESIASNPDILDTLNDPNVGLPARDATRRRLHRCRH